MGRNRRRELCRACYYTPEIRHRYPSISPRGQRSPDWQKEEAEAPLPRAATTALPGTVAKIRAMEQRVAEGEGVFHPADPNREQGHTRRGTRYQAPGQGAYLFEVDEVAQRQQWLEEEIARRAAAEWPNLLARIEARQAAACSAAG